MDDGPLKAKYLTADGAGKISQRAMRALDSTRVKGFNSNGAEMLLALRLRNAAEDGWKVAFDGFFTVWIEEIIRQNVIENFAASVNQLREGDLNTLTWTALQKAKGNICDDLWNNDYINNYIRNAIPFKFNGLFVNILERQLRWAVPATLLGIGRDSVFRLFKANRVRKEILKDPGIPELTKGNAEKLFEEVSKRIGVNTPKAKENLRLDMERYHRACGNGLEMQAQLSETDFFDSQSTDPEQRDNFGVEDGKDSGVGEKAEILFGREFRRTIRDNLRNSNHPATISIVIDFLHHCLNRLKKGDLEAHNAIQEFLNSGEKNPPETDPFGLLLSDALRLLRACVANKLISDPAGPSRGE